jgi:hypothetical protein
MSEQDLKLIRKEFSGNDNKIPEKIRLGNRFVDDFIFDDLEAANIPINALRVIFNIVSIISNEQFQPESRPKQLSLFNDEFETENNTFALLKIRNIKISPSGSTKLVIDAYEYLAKFKMGWYKSINAKGKEIKTFGGLISKPSYDKRGYTSFLINSYWLKKLLVIPEYNYVLYNLVYNIRNNKHIIFAIWLSKIPENGTSLKLSTMNKKFSLNYKNANDFCFKFLKPLKLSLDNYNNISFQFNYNGDLIFINPHFKKIISETKLPLIANEKTNITKRLRYFKVRYQLKDEDMIQFSYQYKTICQTRDLIENAFSEFIKITRMKEIKSTNYKGKLFLYEIQQNVIEIYRSTKMGVLSPNGYPVII